MLLAQKSLVYLVSTTLFIIIVWTRASDDFTHYTSITALDKYGSLPQIRNACAASDLHGALTIVAIAASDPSPTTVPSPIIGPNTFGDANEQVILVASLESQIPGRIHSQGKIQMLTPPQERDNDDSSSLAVIGSGFKADLVFLTNLLRRYACNYWERYDSLLDCHTMAMAASQVMLRFMGYDELAQQTRGAFSRNKEYTDDLSSLLSAIPHVLTDYEQGQEWITFGRPLGLKVFIVQRTQSVSDGQAHIRVVEPSGIISPPIMAHALGQGSKEANRLLRERYKVGMTVQQVQDLTLDIIKEVVLGDPRSGESQTHMHENIILEVLDKHGIRKERLPLVSSTVTNYL